MGLVISEGLRLKSYNTPAAIAGVAPTLDYRFALDRREIEAISLTDKLTYTGATNGTFVNRSGLIERATTDLPRFDHGPASRQSLGLLVEDARTNGLLRSEEFNDGYWTKTNTSVSSDGIAAPDGGIAYKLVENTETGSHAIGRISSVSLPFQSSIFIKPEGRNRISITSGSVSGSPAGTRVDFNLSSLTISTNDLNNSGLIIPIGNGWFRCVANFAVASQARYWIALLDDTSTQSYTGDGVSGVYIWGAQQEAGSSPTSYIPTTTTALTRPVDSAVIDGTGVITGTYTLVDKPAGCAVVNGSNIDLVSGFTAERVMVFPAALSAPQITAIRGAM